ncbi:hypothetical protein ACJMK2_038089, partial [Sinanodonta woodiana]
ALTNLREEVWNFIYHKQSKITAANILLIGPIAAGKSSLVNTIYASFKGHYTPFANSGYAERSFTTK